MSMLKFKRETEILSLSIRVDEKHTNRQCTCTHPHTHTLHTKRANLHVLVYTHTRIHNATPHLHTHPHTHKTTHTHTHTHTHTGEARGASTILSSITPRHRVGIRRAVFTRSRSICVGKLAGLALIARSRAHGRFELARGARQAGATIRTCVPGVALAVGQLITPRL